MEENKSFFQKLANMPKNAQALGFRAFAITLVTAAILFLIGVLIFSQVSGKIPQDDMTAAENTTIEQIRSTTLDSFELGVIGLIVLAAVLIISAVLLIGRG